MATEGVFTWAAKIMPYGPPELLSFDLTVGETFGPQTAIVVAFGR